MNRNLLQSTIESNVKLIDATNLESLIMQIALRYGIPYCRNIVNRALDTLAAEERLSVKSDNA